MAPILIYSSPGRPCSQTNRIFANLCVVLTLLCEKMYELRKKIISTLIILLSGLAAAANFNAILAILLTYSHRRQQKLLAAQINNSSVKIASINSAIKSSKRKNLTRSFWERPGTVVEQEHGGVILCEILSYQMNGEKTFA